MSESRPEEEQRETPWSSTKITQESDQMEGLSELQGFEGEYEEQSFMAAFEANSNTETDAIR